MYASLRFAVLIVALSLAVVSTSWLQADADEPGSSSDAAPKTITINGVLEAISSAEIMADTEQVENLVVKRIVPHGKVIRKGENLVWFDQEDIDNKIKQAETEQRLSALTMQGKDFDYEQFLKIQSLDKAAAERTRKSAQQKYDNFVEVDRDRQVKSAEFNLKSSRASLENAEEELKQLEQMYKEDDLTEESEEIVLKRAKQAVESAQFRFETTEIQVERTLKQEIPQETAEQEATLARAELAYQKSVHELNLARQKRDVERAKEKDELRDKADDLAELKEERKHLVRTSPIDGIALHGKLTRGRLGDKPSNLEVDTKVTSKQVLITVVNPKKLQVRIDLDEEHLAVVQPGAKCKILVKAYPEWEGNGTVKSVSNVPYAANKYDGIVAIQLGKSPPELLPTMTCQLEFVQSEASESTEDAKGDGQE